MGQITGREDQTRIIHSHRCKHGRGSKQETWNAELEILNRIMGKKQAEKFTLT